MLAAKRRILRVLKKIPIEREEGSIILRPTELLKTRLEYNPRIKRWEATDFARRDERGSAFVQKHMRFYTRSEILQHYPKLKKSIEAIDSKR